MDFIILFDSFMFLHIKTSYFLSKFRSLPAQDVWFPAREPFTTKKARMPSTWVWPDQKYDRFSVDSIESFKGKVKTFGH